MRAEGEATPMDETDTTAVLEAARRFVAREVAPYVHEWDEAGAFPRALYARAAAAGLLQLGYPEALGGVPAPWRLRCELSRTLARECASGGVLASLFSHNIALPPIVAHGSEELRRRIVPPVLRGEAIAALAITEPSGGSDVAALRTRAVRDGDHYVIDGEKTYITSGLRADWLTVAVRTDPHGHGAAGISLLAVPGDAPGLTRTELKKMGWWCSDTAQLRFEGVRVPAANLIGVEGQGFKLVMQNFNAERLSMAALAVGFAEACLAEALDWARTRRTFGQPLLAHQAIRHKLADMTMRIESAAAWLAQLAARADAVDSGPAWVAHVCLLKNHATQTMQFCADAAVQILGGMGFMRGTVCERIYREVKVMTIGGGAEEIMKELAARQLGYT
ncbi:MAG TPA: acyl-CoA dehydrogenase family protein [Burkholderiaceae bacterium]|nr:acyl-CoA dehydrogenase family protein [Burkholderiaceae bacterium]